MGFSSVIALAVFAAGCASPPPPPPPPPPVAVVAPPPPPAAPPVAVAYTPDYYVWDGYEYVGVVGDQYVYWHGGVWIVCDPIVLGRFHGWERYHPGWRRSAYYYHRGYYRGRDWHR